jgi:hypothetical protein
MYVDPGDVACDIGEQVPGLQPFVIENWFQTTALLRLEIYAGLVCS